MCETKRNLCPFALPVVCKPTKNQCSVCIHKNCEQHPINERNLYAAQD